MKKLELHNVIEEKRMKANEDTIGFLEELDP